jgi:hypothetical protein
MLLQICCDRCQTFFEEIAVSTHQNCCRRTTSRLGPQALQSPQLITYSDMNKMMKRKFSAEKMAV